MPLLGVVVCGAPLAVRAYDLVEQARRARWEVSLVSTDSAAPWLKANSDVSAHVTGFQMPQQPRLRPDALVVCPLTFNSGNKWALGIADNRPMSLLCEALGSGFPIVAVPMVNASLWKHPAWEEHVMLLEAGGVVMLDPATGQRGAKPMQDGTGEEISRGFDPANLLAVLAESVGQPSR